MNTNQIKNYINNLIENKMDINDKYISITFYEVRIKANLTEEETKVFLKLCKIYLRNKGFRVFLSGEQFCYNQKTVIVQSNELLVAIR